MLLSPESNNSCEFTVSSRDHSHLEQPWSAKIVTQPLSEQRKLDYFKSGKTTRGNIEFTGTQPGRQNIVVHQQRSGCGDSSSLETLKAHNACRIDDRNATFSSAAPFQIDSPTKLENVMEMDELVPPEDSMLLKISGNTATYIDDMDDIESVLSLQPEKLELKNLK